MLQSALLPTNNAFLRRGAACAVWQRLAVWLSGLALLSLLLAPAASIAQDLQTGKLGSICSASGGAPSAPADDQDATPHHAHCPICSVAWGLPMPSAAWAPTQAPQVLALAAVAADPAAPVVGLPFSRGPPAL